MSIPFQSGQRVIVQNGPHAGQLGLVRAVQVVVRLDGAKLDFNLRPEHLASAGPEHEAAARLHARAMQAAFARE